MFPMFSRGGVAAGRKRAKPERGVHPARIALVVVAGSVVIACAGAGPRRSYGFHLRELPSSVTAGEITVPAAPADVYATLVDFDHWTSVFTYLDRVDVEPIDGNDADLVTYGKNGDVDRIRSHADPGRRRLRLDQIGGRANVTGTITVVAGPASDTATIHVQLYADVPGIVGWFVSDAKIRGKREGKVVKDLTCLRDYFAHTRGPALVRSAARFR